MSIGGPERGGTRSREPVVAANEIDLDQVARIGLILAVDRFDPDYGVRFATFARPTINGELKRYLRDAWWPVAVPRRCKDLRSPIASTRRTLEQELGRKPTIAEIADRAGVSGETVAEVEYAQRTLHTAPLDHPIHAAPGGVWPRTVDLDADVTVSGLEVRRAMGGLGRRDRLIVLWRFFEGLTQREIGERLGLSQVQVSRLLARSLEFLRQCLAAFAAESDDCRTERTST